MDPVFSNISAYLQNNCIGCSVRKEEIILRLPSGENLNLVTTILLCLLGD